MEKIKDFITILVLGITIGVVLMVILVFVVGANPKKITVGGVEFEIPTPASITPIAPSIEITAQGSPFPTNVPFTNASAIEVLPEGVNSASEMPDWLTANVGGTKNQWQQVQNGKWRFRTGNSGGVGDNQILSPKAGYLVFGADSGKKDNNGSVIWKDVSIGPGENTFWKCGESNKSGTIDAADWTLTNPNIGTSCG